MKLRLRPYELISTLLVAHEERPGGLFDETHLLRAHIAHSKQGIKDPFGHERADKTLCMLARLGERCTERILPSDVPKVNVAPSWTGEDERTAVDL